jgi:hypothetical protein
VQALTDKEIKNMPANVVKTKRDERLWNEAKAQVRKEYPGVAEDSDRFYRLVNGIYQRMKSGVGGGKMAKADVKEPGKRGGKYYMNEAGHVQYGEKPTGAKQKQKSKWGLVPYTPESVDTREKAHRRAMETGKRVRFTEGAGGFVEPTGHSMAWKLRLWETPKLKETPRQVGRAMAALGPGGFRGNRVEIPAGDLAAVRAKVRAAWKRMHKGADQKAPGVLQKSLSVDSAGYILFGNQRA